MTLKEIRGEINYYSEKASDVNQKLALAGIAIAWLFTETSEGQISLNSSLIISLAFFVLALTFDLLHYAVFAPIYRSYYIKNMYQQDKNENEDQKEGKVQESSIESLRSEEEEVGQPLKTNDLSWLFFFLKVISVIVGYIALMFSILKQINVS